jgi:hypothetical protein
MPEVDACVQQLAHCDNCHEFPFGYSWFGFAGDLLGTFAFELIPNAYFSFQFSKPNSFPQIGSV